jgi:hypothetical protein
MITQILGRLPRFPSDFVGKGAKAANLPGSLHKRLENTGKIGGLEGREQ